MRRRILILQAAVVCLLGSLMAFGADLPSGTLVLSKEHPNEQLVESGFIPLKAEVGQSWEQIPVPAQDVSTIRPAIFNNELWLFCDGNWGSTNSVWRLEDEGRWSQIAESPLKSSPKLFEYNGALWGLSMNTFGIQYTSDGVKWNIETNGMPWTSKSMPELVVHDGKLIAVGAERVWFHTTEGEWESICDTPPWGSLSGFSVVSFKKNIYLIGGDQKESRFTKPTASVWISRDGSKWEMLLEGNVVPAFPPRSGHACVALDDTLYIIGGAYSWSQGLGGKSESHTYNDVWMSGNGKDWTLVCNDATWEPRVFNNLAGNAVAHKGSLYIVGGSRERLASSRGKDIWVTSQVRRNSDGFYYYKKK